jgi:hypothetical protein
VKRRGLGPVAGEGRLVAPGRALLRLSSLRTINDSTFDLRARRAHALRIRPERSDCAIDEAARARRRTGPIGAPA